MGARGVRRRANFYVSINVYVYACVLLRFLYHFIVRYSTHSKIITTGKYDYLKLGNKGLEEKRENTGYARRKVGKFCLFLQFPCQSRRLVIIIITENKNDSLPSKIFPFFFLFFFSFFLFFFREFNSLFLFTTNSFRHLWRKIIKDTTNILANLMDGLISVDLDYKENISKPMDVS